MAKWSCRCGYPMNDHMGPDPNGFCVYSDELWDEITDKTDDNNKIDYYDISEASFYMWKCPSCGSFMVFGEDDDPDRYTFYRREFFEGEKPKVEANLKEIFIPNTEVRLANVCFTEAGEEYTYICADNSIQVGHYVIVPVGPKNTEKIAQVVLIYKALPKDIIYPLDKLKQVIKRYSEFDESRVQDIVSDLLVGGNVLNLLGDLKQKTSDAKWDLVQTPLGNFWLELNGVPIPMKVKVLETPLNRYHVDGSLHIQPYKVNCRSFHSLSLCADFDVDGARWIDSLSDEYVWGNSWELNGLHFGITGKESLEFEDELTTKRYSRLPYYKTWHSDWQDYYGFNLAWKDYESDEDLSVFFHTT